jgi:hypothetical protein
MDVENIIAEFQLDDSVVYVNRRDYLNKDYKKITEYIFSYGTLSGARKTTNSTHKSIGGVMKKFNKAVDAIKNGTKIK